MVTVSNVVISEFCLPVNVHLINSSDNGDFKITTVYGPTDYALKAQFFAKLINFKPPQGVRWLALDDFNQIRKARDKNKGNVNCSHMICFTDALQACDLNKIHLQNLWFTWSSEREIPTLCKLDAFY
jgi:hypothetical protein